MKKQFIVLVSFDWRTSSWRTSKASIFTSVSLRKPTVVNLLDFLRDRGAVKKSQGNNVQLWLRNTVEQTTLLFKYAKSFQCIVHDTYQTSNVISGR